MRRILITGTTGMLGADVTKVFAADSQYQVFGAGRSISPLLPADRQVTVDFSSSLSSAKFPKVDWIIHTAAITDLGLCEREPALAEAVHVNASRQLAELGAKFIYISTDSVFDGRRGGYKEEDEPNPLNVYARTKLEGERAVQSVSKDALIARTNIYGYHQPMKNSLAEWALKEWKAGKTINGFTDIKFNAVYTGQLAMIIKSLVDGEKHYPVLNIGSSESISKYEFLVRLARAAGVATSLVAPRSSSEFPSALPRPENTSLDTTLLSKFLRVPTFDEGLKKVVSALV